ncbi:hypothetical protein ACHAXR_010725 [Thalassiosira sp. AJA248-18]
MSGKSSSLQSIVPLLALAGNGIERCSSFSFSHHTSALVPRLTVDEYLASPVYKTPVLIRDIVSPETIESLADDLMRILGEEEVQMQRKIKDEDDGSQTTEIYDIALQDSIEYLMDSSHYDSYFAFCEGLLPSALPGSSNLSESLKDIREAPFAGRENWFDYFPSKIKPTDAIVLAGAGATSTFHRDPFEWTGTSLCLEGTKIWRFILPPSEGGVGIVDEALQSYRLDSIAWEDEEENTSDEPVVLSAGWQSDMTLYDTIDINNFPSAFEWVTMEEDDREKFQREMENAGMDMSCLCPGKKSFDALDQIMSTSPSVATAIQQPGDLLLIPAHCWHQTYAPLPSVAVASQRCGADIDGANVIGHMLETVNCDKEKLPDILKCNVYDEGLGREVVAKVLEHVTPNIKLKPNKITSSANLSISFVESQGKGLDGPTTLFIHGLDSSSQTWRGVQQSLATPSVAIDCRGCGRSELGDPNTFSPDALVEDVKSVAQSLLPDKRFVLVGHSMGGRVAMCYAAKYPDDVSALVIEDMDIRRRSVQSNFIHNFDEVKAVAFERGHKTLDNVKTELEGIGYSSDMYNKWIDEGRIYEDTSDDGNKFWSDVNPAFRALCYRTIFDSDSGTDSWSAIKSANNVHLMVAGVGTVCDEVSIEEMRKIIQAGSSTLSVKTYAQGTHSIHNSARGEFLADLCQIIKDSK